MKADMHLVTLLITLAFVIAAQAAACSCLHESATEAWEKTPVIFIGHIDRTETHALPGKKWSFFNGSSAGYTTQKSWLKVDQPFKGTNVGDIFTTEEGTGAGDCTMTFDEQDKHDQFLFYVYPSPAVVLGCTRTRRLAEAGDDLLFLQALPSSAKRTRISGTVSEVRGVGPDMFHHVRSLANIQILISSDFEVRETKTGSNGAFEVMDLPPGRYQIRAAIPSSDSLIFSYIVGKGASQLGTSGTAQQPQPFLLQSQSGMEVDFLLVPNELLEHRKKQARRDNK